MDGTEWHNVGAYRFGWDARLDSGRFVVLKGRGWFWRRRYSALATGRVEYGIVEDGELRARALAALELTRGVRASDMRCVYFVTDDGAELDPRLCACMAGRWHEMQLRLRSS